MDMVDWVLIGADKQEVPVTTYPGQDLVEADLSDVPDVYQDLHWHAPKTYLGDKVTALTSSPGRQGNGLNEFTALMSSPGRQGNGLNEFTWETR